MKTGSCKGFLAVQRVPFRVPLEGRAYNPEADVALQTSNSNGFKVGT